MRYALRIVRLYSTSGDPVKRLQFEDAMRDGEWRAEKRQVRKNEFLIRPGDRKYWTLVILQSQAQLDAILAVLGIP